VSCNTLILTQLNSIYNQKNEDLRYLVNLQVQSGDFLSDGIGAGRISDDLLHVSEHNLFLCGEIADDYKEKV
jgi:hypothetical protein